MVQWLQKNRQAALVALWMGIVAVLAVLVTYVLARRPVPAPIVIRPITPLPTPSARPTTVPDPVAVYVVGAVVRPGVYTIPWDSRVVQALDAAGGATADADLVRVNLAGHVVDGQQIYIPTRLEAETPVLPTSAAPAIAKGMTGPGQKINVNQATAQDLEALPGIGPAIAQRMLDYRTEHGPFKSIEELEKVRGIGEATLARIRDQVTVD